MNYHNILGVIGSIPKEAVSGEAIVAAAEAAKGERQGSLLDRTGWSTYHRESDIPERFAAEWPEANATLVPCQHTYRAQFWVCFPNETLPRGWIGYGYHESFALETPPKYMIYSMTLEDYRYRNSSSERKHMSVSNTFSAIMKRAKKAFLPIPAKIVCGHRKHAHSNAVYDFITTKKKMVADAYHKVTGMKLLDTYKKLPSAAEWPFIQELKALEYVNHKWANSAVGAAVPELLASISDLDHAEQNKYDPMDFLWPDRGRINVLRVGKMPDGAFWSSLDSCDEISYGSTEDLPASYRGKLAMLQVVPEGTFLPNVGTHIDGGYFLFQGNEGAA